MLLFRDHLNEMVATDPEFRAEWEALEPERQLTHGVIGARIAAGLTIAELAERIDRTPETLVRLEYGESQPTLETLRRLATALNVTTEISPEYRFGFRKLD